MAAPRASSVAPVPRPPQPIRPILISVDLGSGSGSGMHQRHLRGGSGTSQSQGRLPEKGPTRGIGVRGRVHRRGSRKRVPGGFHPCGRSRQALAAPASLFSQDTPPGSAIEGRGGWSIAGRGRGQGAESRLSPPSPPAPGSPRGGAESPGSGARRAAARSGRPGREKPPCGR